MKYFNTAESCNNIEHYMIGAVTSRDLIKRFNADGKYYVPQCSQEKIQNIIEQERYIPTIIRHTEYKLDFTNISHHYEKDKN